MHCPKGRCGRAVEVSAVVGEGRGGCGAAQEGGRDPRSARTPINTEMALKTCGVLAQGMNKKIRKIQGS